MEAPASEFWNQPPLRHVRENPQNPLDRSAWPGTLAPVRDLLGGRTFSAATVLVGENGVGKSTLVESIAVAFGFPSEGGSLAHQRGSSEGSPELAEHLQLVRTAGRFSDGFFLRAEAMHGFTDYLAGHGSVRGHRYQHRSHGQYFLEVLDDAPEGPGLWVLDEPESALSFQGQLNLLARLIERLDSGAQVLLCTHSPLLARLPGAVILEAGPWGLRESTWSDLEFVQHWERFMAAPERYLHHF